MIKKILSISLALFACFSSGAQVQVGDVAPDFTLPDINGQTHHLYSYLDSGYTVILDLSAAWCAPCWAGHTSHVLNDLVDHYGRNGSITPGKVKVFLIEGEIRNTIAQLHGISSGGNNTQGDWVTGTNYPIIDSSALNGIYNNGGYPVYTVICRDRLVAARIDGYEPSMDEAFWMKYVNNNCPAYAPSGSVDAKAVHYNDTDFYYCSANPTIRFQNYSNNALSAATIRMYSGSTVVATQAWTGSLAPYAVATVPIAPFKGSTFSNYSFEVVAAGDTRTANDRSRDSLFKLYTAATARSIPSIEDFEWRQAPAYYYSTIGAMTKYTYLPVIGLVDSATGAGGTPTKAMRMDFISLEINKPADFVYGSYNTKNIGNLVLEFDYAYSATSATPLSVLEVLVSTDCGSHWTSAWSRSGTALVTMPVSAPYTTPVPSAVSQWKHVSVPMDAYRDSNMLMKVRTETHNFIGNGVGWLDNLKLSGTLGIGSAIAANSISLAPNPAGTETMLRFSLAQSATVRIDVVDATGRIVATVANSSMAAGAQTIRIATGAFAPGIYQVLFRTPEGVVTQRLAVLR